MRGLSWDFRSRIVETTSLANAEGQTTAWIHATCVAVEGRGILILGLSGAGKSALALQMMALGAELVSDDRVALAMKGDQVVADTVPPIYGLIEARGIGLLRATPAGPASVHYVVDLDQKETARLPEHHFIPVLRRTVPLLRGAGVPNLAAALIQIAKMGRVDPEWPST